MIKVHILSTRKNCNGTVYLTCGEGEDADGRNDAEPGKAPSTLKAQPLSDGASISCPASIRHPV